MKIEELNVPSPWGTIKAQLFSSKSSDSTGNGREGIPIIAIHGTLDNSNSFKPISEYLTENGLYYVISIDLPGHGLSSKGPSGIPYSSKLFLISIKRLVRYLNLKDFILLTHSYGTTLGVMYATLYGEEVKAIISIDWIFHFDKSNWMYAADVWKDGIDKYLNAETIDVTKENDKKEPLTYERALKM
jgi:pimeloyl-ACP methyl ester carboxylesterase